MPIKVVDIKKLSEQDCYTWSRLDGLAEKIIVFLKKNKGNAYSVKEIAKNVECMTEYGDIKPSKNSVHNAIYRIVNRSRFTAITKKGSYYWYEEK